MEPMQIGSSTDSSNQENNNNIIMATVRRDKGKGCNTKLILLGSAILVFVVLLIGGITLGKGTADQVRKGDGGLMKDEPKNDQPQQVGQAKQDVSANGGNPVVPGSRRIIMEFEKLMGNTSTNGKVTIETRPDWAPKGTNNMRRR